MRQNRKVTKWRKHIAARMRYQIKRHSLKWRRKKLRRKLNHAEEATAIERQMRKPFQDHVAPQHFSFIKHTNRVLEFFITAEKRLRKKENLNLDISNVEELSSDAITLLIASINDKDFKHTAIIKGNSPKKPELNKLFRQSGFNHFVPSSRGFDPKKEGHLLHKERNHKVVPLIAKEAALTGIRHTFGNEVPYEPLYDILIECMSNTNNHANPKSQGKCKWWLYVYNDPKSSITSYSFLDLGVGIFESVIVKNYVKQFLKGSIMYKNIKFADDLLNGKIQSRVDKDKEIRGKGIPQIVDYSKLSTFKEFYIITNAVKINVKTGYKEQLDYNLKGTFLYWELQPN